MKSVTFVSIFMALMVLIGSVMTPATVNETAQEIETEIVEVENF